MGLMLLHSYNMLELCCCGSACFCYVLRPLLLHHHHLNAFICPSLLPHPPFLFLPCCMHAFVSFIDTRTWYSLMHKHTLSSKSKHRWLNVFFQQVSKFNLISHQIDHLQPTSEHSCWRNKYGACMHTHIHTLICTHIC